ncbi:testin-like [Convolutriloba macropyga]|uniref:testin-like n=1 Tax=Convolutriloba macropyga TaxID=536237 RepID=UPI003F51EF5B
MNGVAAQEETENAKEEVPRESIRTIDDIRALRIQRGKSLKHDVGAGAPCLKCGDACEGGFALHFWRKICMTCKCPPENHDIQAESTIQHKIGKLFGRDHVEQYGQFYTLDTNELVGGTNNKTRDAKRAAEYKKIASDAGGDEKDTITFEWVPSNTPKNLVLKYISSLPLENQPIKGTVGAAERTKQLQKQLPTHDVDPSACKAVKESELDAFSTFVESYKKTALGIGNVKEQLGDQKWACENCKEPCLPGSVAVFADRAGPDKCWHPACFRCADCNELLVDLIYFWDQDKLYCGRHYANRHRPRCNACDELIMSGQYTQAEDANWHVQHFCCWNCDTLLGGHQYINKEGHPYCMNCYSDKFAKTCSTCHEKIDATKSRLSYLESAWHATPECFRCIQCHKNLMGQPFISKHGVLYCSKQCRKAHAATNTNL